MRLRGRRRSGVREVAFVTRRGCTMCAEAQPVVERVAARAGVPLVVLDVDADPTLAEVAGVNSAKLRKDLSHLGSYGTRGVGYDVQHLVSQISRELGLLRRCSVVLVGVGNLGRALAGYGGFASRGLAINALLDADPSLTGEQFAGLTVRHIDELSQVVVPGSIGVIATPASAAQEVCDQLVGAGVTSILNFA